MWYLLRLHNENARTAAGPMTLYIPDHHGNELEELGAEIQDINPNKIPFIMVLFKSSQRVFDTFVKAHRKYMITDHELLIEAADPENPLNPLNTYLLCFAGNYAVEHFMKIVLPTPAFGRIGFKPDVQEALETYANQIKEVDIEILDEFYLEKIILHIEQYRTTIEFKYWKDLALHYGIIDDLRYTPIWDDPNHASDFERAIAIFRNYEQNAGFFSGHPFRRHANNIRDILNNLAELDTLESLLAKMQALNPSDSGSMAKRITYINYQVTQAKLEAIVADPMPPNGLHPH